jgi:hypothetical protein
MKLLLILIVMFSFCNIPIIQNKLEGEWVMCKTEKNDIMATDNVCPKVKFSKDNQGKITFAYGEISSFTYNLISDNKIELSFKGDSYPFDETVYFYKIFEDSIKYKTYESTIKAVKIEKLEIFSLDKKSRYFLLREKE